MATTNRTPSESFLAAWEEAGKPPVKKLVYPRYGDGRDKVLTSHSEIRTLATLDPETYPGMEFRDNGEDVTLTWVYGNPDVTHSQSGSTQLYFDRSRSIGR